MKELFEEYLVARGYSCRTPEGKPSTVYDYIGRIEKVCQWEGCTWETLAENIDNLISAYDAGGINESRGCQSHRAVINALKRFRDFIHQK